MLKANQLRLLLYLPLAFALFSLSPGFKKEQLKQSRVKKAFDEKSSELDKLLENKHLSRGNLLLHLRGYKAENELELWGKTREDTVYQLIKTYAICAASGLPGPKRKEGDLQVPEGLYHIAPGRFNPWSSFHLSLGLNYPNASDRILSDKQRPGGDIFIHGSCASIGCLSMTDPFIQEIYVLAVEAINNGQKDIPVHIFPAKMSSAKMKDLYKNYPQHQKFWENLEIHWDYFEKKKKIGSFVVATNGKYQLQ